MKRKKKFFLVLPLLVLPFITLAFWALGGGKVQDETKVAAGLNLSLPDAKLKDEKNLDKLSFYDQAERDSLRREEALRSDPNYHIRPDTSLTVMQMIPRNQLQNINPESSIDVNEKRIYSKINELNKQISKPDSRPAPSGDKEFSEQVDRLQDMMKDMSANNTTDSETIRLNGMMEKILDIQHPDRVKQKLEKSLVNKTQVYPVEVSMRNNTISLISEKDQKQSNSFFGFTDANNDDSTDHAIEAVVHETQTVVSGSTIKMRLLSDVYVNGILIPKGNFLYGIASLENERLNIMINSIRYLNNLLPVALQVYDMDGMAGIHIPGSIVRESAKESAQKTLQQIELASIDPSVAAQVTDAGISAAKNLLSKKAKLVKVTLKAGYKILLNNKV